MKNIITITFLITTTFSCTTKNENILKELNKLNYENDSLRKILVEVNKKYIFDSIS